MKAVTKTVYEAFDATTFDTAADCKAYEKSMAHAAIVGLTDAEALAILTREDSERADLVEHLGKVIERKRLDAGEFRRQDHRSLGGHRRPAQNNGAEAAPPEPSRQDDEDETACTSCGVMFTGEEGQVECDGCAAETLTDLRDAAGDAGHERARDRRAEGE